MACEEVRSQIFRLLNLELTTRRSIVALEASESWRVMGTLAVRQRSDVLSWWSHWIALVNTQPGATLSDVTHPCQKFEQWVWTGLSNKQTPEFSHWSKGTKYNPHPGNFIQSSTVSLCLNLRPARSAERKRNWFPWSSNSRWGRCRTVVFGTSGSGVGSGWFCVYETGRVEYNGTAKENIEFSFGMTGVCSLLR